MTKELSNTALNNLLRKEYMDLVGGFLSEQGYELLATASNELTIPCVDASGEEKYITLKFVIPKGSKDELYDGYAMAESYELHLKEVAEKKAKAKAAAEAKKKRDAELRAKAKAAKEARQSENE